MGFDIECIIDIHSYPGEYFCPVCRTLVYPNEAFQAQCTHLYCKPCLAHVANGSRACPYDGYLVTESDSKPLMESDKALAEKVGKVKVHCLYFRSGCTWEGSLSDCASHGSGCTFGNSPVICNRCGIQLVHRQVHDHAQICPGVYDGQQAVAGASASALTRPGTTSSTVTAVANQTVALPAAPVSQAQNPPNVASTPLPGQNPNVQVNAISHTPGAAPAAVAAPDPWYQQQYQQYYQQYMGYDPYQQQQQQQQQQQYYALPQQPIQQYQQHQVQVQGQQQSQVYPQVSHAQTQPQTQPQPPQTQVQGQNQQHLQQQPQSVQQSHPVPQALPQAHTQSQAQGQAPTQQQPQPQFQMLPQGQTQVQAHAPVQGLAPNYQVNTPQPPHPAMRPQTQIPPQVPPPPPPHSQSTQPSQYQGIGMRPPAQQPQVPQYQQPHVQMQHSQASQSHAQPQMHLQPHPYTQSSNQSNVQIQPQTQPYQSQSQPPNFHPQANQSGPPASMAQAPHPPAPPVSGHHSYQQPLPVQNMQPGAPQQHPMQPHPASGSLHPIQAHGQVPQQPAHMRPPQSHVSVSQQHPSVPTQSQVSGAPLASNQQFPPHGPQPTYPIQHRPQMQSVQQVPPQNYTQQQQFHAPFQGQMYQQGHLHPQQPMQSQLQMRPSGPPQPQQSQNYMGTPMIPNQGTHPQSHQLSYGGFGPVAPSGPAQPGSTQTPVNQNYAKPNEQNSAVNETKSPSKLGPGKGFERESVKEEGGPGQNGTIHKDADNAEKDGLIKSVTKQEMGSFKGVLEQTSGGNSSEAGGAEDKFCKEEVHALTDTVPLKPVDLDNQMNLSNPAVAGQSSANYDRLSLSAPPSSSTEGHLLPPKPHGLGQERSQAKVEGQPSSVVGPQGPAAMPHHGQSLNPTEGNTPSNFGGPPRSFESHFGSQGSEPTSLADPRGTIGRAPPHYAEGHYGSQHLVRPSEVMMPRDQLSGSTEGGPLDKPHAEESNFLRVNGRSGPDSSMFGSRDDNSKPLSREQLNFFPREPTYPLEQASRSLDKPFHDPTYDAGSKLDTGVGQHSRLLQHRPSGGQSHGDVRGPEFGQHHTKPFSYQSPAGDYLGSPPRGFGGPMSFPRGSLALDDFNSREGHRFGEGPRAFNHSSDPAGNAFRDGGFPPMPGHLRRGDIDGPRNSGYGEHRTPTLMGDNVFGPDGPGPVMREKFSGPGFMHSHFNMGEIAGPGTFSGPGRAGEAAGNFTRPPFSDSGRGDLPGYRPFGEPAMRNNYPFHGFGNAGNFSGGVDSFDQSRKRKPLSTGWCRICEIDCETVEGLEMHSQTREHQNVAMDIVKSIKRQNKKKPRAAGHSMHEGGSRSRKVGTGGRGNKA